MANGRFGLHTFTARGRRERAGRRRSSILLSTAGVMGTMLSFAAVGGGTTATAVVPVISHAPRVAVPHGVHQTWSASNWSGYAESGAYTGVSGTWTVPSVAASSSATYSSVWIGVDGFSNSSLIQTGTEEDYYNGASHYNAWWEILPAAETAISQSSYPVSPGDRMSASIYETPNTVTVTTSSHGNHRTTTTEHQWVIKISDGSKWSFSTTQAYGGSGSSAEWIVEAPQVGGRIAPLAHYAFGTANGLGTSLGDIDNAGILTTIPSGVPTYAAAGLNYQNDAGTMVQNNVTVSSPSGTDAAATAYNAAYGATAPAAPSS
jgi:hypothetical protein